MHCKTLHELCVLLFHSGVFWRTKIYLTLLSLIYQCFLHGQCSLSCVTSTSVLTSWPQRFSPRNVIVFFFTFRSPVHLEWLLCVVWGGTPGMWAVFSRCPAVGVLLWDFVVSRRPWGVLSSWIFSSMPSVYFLSFHWHPTAFPPLAFHLMLSAAVGDHCLHPSLSSKIKKMVISNIYSGFIGWKMCIKKKNPLFAHSECMWLKEPFNS